MNDVLRDRIRRNLEALPEDRLYQVLDYIEFLNSKYARQPVKQGSPFQRFGEKLEDRMRLNRIGYDAIRNTLGVVGTADRMVSGLTEAGKSIIREVGAGAMPPEAQPPRQQSGTAAETPPALPERRRDLRIDE